jgi:hypothetical protein
MGSILAQVWVELSHENGVVFMVTLKVLMLTNAISPSRKFEHPPFWNQSYKIKNYDIEVSFSGLTSLLNFVKITNWFRSY